jgi:hypothetical protein
MVGALQVHHLEPDWLTAEVIFVSEEDIYLDLADWRAGKARYNAMEDSPAGLELLLLDAQLLQGVTVEDVDAATTVYQNSGEATGSPLR